MPATLGWRLNDAAFQNEMDDEIQRNMDGGMKFLPQERWFQGKTKEEWVDMMRMASEHAEFERI